MSEAIDSVGAGDGSGDDELLAQATRRWLTRHHDFASRRRLRDGAADRAAIRAGLGELGLLALPVPVAAGGYGGSARMLGRIMEEFGRALLVEPYVANILLGACALAACDGARASELLADVFSGERQLALAWQEPGQPALAVAAGQCTAQETPQGFLLQGHKSFVMNAPGADEILVTARLADGRARLFRLERGTPGLSVTGCGTLDGMTAAEVALDRCTVAADAACAAPQIDELLADVLDRATLACLSEAVGAMDAAFELTRDYLQTRRQFGRAIGEFQVLRHRLVDMFIALAESRAIVAHAVGLVDAQDADARRAISAAKVKLATTGRFVGQQAIQLHGAIGLTDEYPVGHYYKRIEAIATAFGDADEHLDRYIADGGND